MAFRGRWKFPQVTAVAKFTLKEIFYKIVEIWRGVILTIQTFFKAKKNILLTLIKVKINMIWVFKEYKVKIKMAQKQWQQQKS